MDFEFVNKKLGYEYYNDIILYQYISKVLSEKLSIFFKDKIINYILGLSFTSPYWYSLQSKSIYVLHGNYIVTSSLMLFAQTE